jgi:hypothetical protein
MDRHPIEPDAAIVNELANLIFYFIFLTEMILKLTGLGIRGYMSDSFNIFDGIIVILSTIELVLFFTGVGGSGGSAISAFRAFRLMRVFKLAK